MKQLKDKLHHLWDNLEKRLPEKQIYFRTNGVVQFKRVSTAVQMAGFSMVGAFVLWVVMVSVNYLTRDIVLEAREKQINEISEEYARALGDIETLQERLLARLNALESRQTYLQTIMAGDPLQSLSPDLDDGKTIHGASDSGATSSDKALEAIDRISSLSFTPDNLRRVRANIYPMERLVENAETRLDALSGKQMQLADGLIQLANVRIKDINSRIAETGLKAQDLAAFWNGSTQNLGVGGPYMPVSNSPVLETRLLVGPKDYLENDPFMQSHKELKNIWAKMQKAHDSISSIPTIEPAADYYISSRYGRRIDPFKKKTAIHYGLDMAGWPGTKIFVTAPGKVTKAGPNGAYGRMVEVDHGNGFKTRYGHMRKVKVKEGQIVQRGQTIGEMGCSGRCTSTHLHYEVWFGGKPRNPLPYVRKAERIIELENSLNEIENNITLEGE